MMIDKVKIVQFLLETNLSYYLSLLFPWQSLLLEVLQFSLQHIVHIEARSVQGEVWGAEQR